MAVLNALLTVSEFSRLPQPSGGIRQELHHGELVELPPVKVLHTILQLRLVSALKRAADLSVYEAAGEFPFQPVEEFDVRVADVALFRISDLKKAARNGYFRGVPEIVIEVLSPSNTASEMMDRETICLHNGGKEFWLVDPNRKSVRVVRADGYSRVYSCDEDIVSEVLGGSISASELFEDLTD
jgi:Uma2 family endonuclease